MRIDTLKQVAGAPALAAVLGAAIGWVGWWPPVWFPILWLLPLAWGFPSLQARTRSALIVGYYLTALGPIWPAMAEFSGSGGAGVAVWLIATVLLSFPYVLLSRWRFAGVAWAIALTVTALPPLGIFGLASPLFAATTSFPHTGLVGLAIGIVLQSLLASGLPRSRWPAVATTVLVAGLSWTLAPTPARTLPVIPLQTDLGRTPRHASHWVDRQVRLVKRVGRTIRDHRPGRILLLPEDIAGTWTDIATWTWQPIAALAARHHDVVLVGATLQKHHGRIDGLVMMGQVTGIIAARQPIPVGEWNPFARNGYVADVWRFGPSKIGTLHAAVTVCYEQLLVWPSAWAFISRTHRPTAILAPSNHGWSGHDMTEVRIQHGAVRALGILYGVPVYLADNHARAAR